MNHQFPQPLMHARFTAPAPDVQELVQIHQLAFRIRPRIQGTELEYGRDQLGKTSCALVDALHDLLSLGQILIGKKIGASDDRAERSAELMVHVVQELILELLQLFLSLVRER